MANRKVRRFTIRKFHILGEWVSFFKFWGKKRSSGQKNWGSVSEFHSGHVWGWTAEIHTMKTQTREICTAFNLGQKTCNLLSKSALTRATSRWIFLKNKKKNHKVKLSVNLKILAFYGGRAERMEQQHFFFFFLFDCSFSESSQRMIAEWGRQETGVGDLGKY